jgi:hypothetical protein
MKVELNPAAVKDVPPRDEDFYRYLNSVEEFEVLKLTSRALDLPSARYDLGAPWALMTESPGEGC